MSRKKALTGNEDEAIALQERIGLPPPLRGLWFHSSKDRVPEMGEQSEMMFFTRSPHGWTGWGGHRSGDPVFAAYVIAPFDSPESRPVDPHVYPGDADAFEEKLPLPKWWLVVDPRDVDKLMVVERFVQSDVVRVAEYSARPAYTAMRQAAIELLKPAGR